MHRSIRCRCLAIPVLLSIVACNHIFRHYRYQQSSWGAGCGFGMFATLDYHGTRFFRATVVQDNDQAPAGFRSHFPVYDMKAKVLPSDRNMNGYAYALLRSGWQLRQPTRPVSVGTSSATSAVGRSAECCFAVDNSGGRKASSVELELWGIRFSPAKRTVAAFPIRCVKVNGS